MRCTWIEVHQVAHTHAVVLSRPWWMWGAEMGANEHGVVIGNEAVFTHAGSEPPPDCSAWTCSAWRWSGPPPRRRRSRSSSACWSATDRAEPAATTRPSFTYDNSFLVADPDGAIVLETAGRRHATEEVRGPGRSISNGLTIPGFAEAHADAAPGPGGGVRGPPGPDPGVRRGRHRHAGPDGRPPGPRAGRPAPLLHRQRCPGRSVRPRRRGRHLHPDHGLLGGGPPGPHGGAALGHRHVGPLHVAVQAGPGGPAHRPGAPAGRPRRSGHRVVAPRAPAPRHHGGPADACSPASPTSGTGPRRPGWPTRPPRSTPSPGPTSWRPAGPPTWSTPASPTDGVGACAATGPDRTGPRGCRPEPAGTGR